MEDYDSFPTPPDTVAVRKALLRHRSDLLAAKQTTFARYTTSDGDGEGTPSRGTTLSLKAHRPDPNSAAVMNYGSPEVASAPSSHPRASSQSPFSADALKDLVLYTNPALSFLTILGGIFALTTIRYIISGPHQMTLLSAVCYLALAELAINFFRSLLSSTPATSGTWTNSRLVSSAISTSIKCIDSVASLHDEYLACRDPMVSVKVGGALWGVAIIGHVFSIWGLVSFTFVLAFTVPYLMSTNWESVTTAAHTATAVLAARYHALGLTRKQKACIVAGALFYVWMRFSWSYRIIGMFVGAMVIRSNLKPAEVAAIRQHAAPLTASVKKRAMAARNYFNSMNNASSSSYPRRRR